MHRHSQCHWKGEHFLALIGERAHRIIEAYDVVDGERYWTGLVALRTNRVVNSIERRFISRLWQHDRDVHWFRPRD
jgi:hypothetical protein